jgi:hypothetical protein
MRRTNIYLDERQLALLRGISQSRREPVAALVREAIDAWLEANGVREIDRDEWERRFDTLLSRRRKVAQQEGFDPDQVERDVMEAVRQVRKGRG